MHFYTGTGRNKAAHNPEVSIVSQLGVDSLLSVAEKMGLSEDERRVASVLVLLNPDLLMTQYPTSEVLASEAESYAKKGNVIVASNRFASAAKLALYAGDLSSARKYLEKTVTLDKNSSFAIALTNFDSVSKCVVEFYKSKSGRVS